MGFRSDIKSQSPSQPQPVVQQPQQQGGFRFFNPFKRVQEQAIGVGNLLNRGVKSLPRLRSNQEVASAALGVGKGIARSTALPLAKLGIFASPLYNPLTKEKLNQLSSRTNEILAPQSEQERAGQTVGKIGGNLLTYGLAGKVASPLNVGKRVAGIVGGTAAGQADVPEGKSRGKKALTDAALLTAFAGAGAGIDKIKALRAAKAGVPQTTATVPGLTAKQVSNLKGKTVYRGTIGEGELENILTGSARYNRSAVGTGEWTGVRKEAERYAREGATLLTGGKKAVGTGNYLIEGKQLADGSIIPVKAVDVFNKKTIPLLRSETAGKIAAQADDSVSKITKALREAKPLRSKQEAIYSQVRGERLAKGIAAEKAAGGGQAGYLAKRAELAGELPKVDFQSLKGKVKQADIDDLFNKVAKSDLNEWEKLPANEGLSKLLGASGGQVPTNNEIRLLSRVFPDEFIAETLAKRSTMQKLFEGTANVLNIPRTALATADLSAPLRQGIFLGPKHPVLFGKNFGRMFKQFGNEKYYKQSLDNIRSRPTYGEMVKNKLEITDASSPTLSAREESFMSNLLERVPGVGSVVKASNRAYSGFLNNMRADVFDQIYNNAVKSGALERNPGLLESAARFVNSASGRGSLGQLNSAVPILNAGLFSPRLIASRVNLLNPVYYAKLDPFVRKEALKTAASFAGFLGTVLGLAKAGGADVETDIRSTDFGQVKVGNTRYDFTGGFRPYIVLGGRLASGESINPATGELRELGSGFTQSSRADILGRFGRSKFSPVASFVYDALSGSTFTGEEFQPDKALVDRMIPLLAQDIYDVQQEEGFSQVIPAAVGSTFGVGINTFRENVPTRGTTESGRSKVEFKPAPSLGETILNSITGEEVSNIPEEQRAPLLAKRKKEQEDKAQLSFVKAEVKRTGKSQVYKDKIVYRDQNGDVKVRSR